MTTPKEEQKHTLLPCPFCGGIVCSYSQQSRYDPENSKSRNGLLYRPTISIYCGACSLSMTTDADLSDPFGNKSYALINAKWNTRKADCHEELVAIAIRDYFRETVDQEHYADGDFAIKGDEWVSIGEQDINVAALAKDILAALARATNHQGEPS